MGDGTLIHIAGEPVQVGTQLRQRCSWCGAVIIDEDLSSVSMVADPVDELAGNAVTPPVMQWITGRILQALEGAA